MTRILRFACPVLSTGLLAAGYFFSGLDWFAVALFVFGILWIVGLALRWEWIPPLSLFTIFGVAALGLLQGLSTLFLIAGSLFALLAWDLADFHLRLQKSSLEDDLTVLEKHHLLRLGFLGFSGAGLSAFALTLHLDPSFEWTVILMLFAVWGLGRVVERLLNIES